MSSTILLQVLRRAGPWIVKQVPKLWPLLLESKNRDAVMRFAQDLASRSPNKRLKAEVELTGVVAERMTTTATTDEERELAAEWSRRARNLALRVDLPMTGREARKAHRSAIRSQLQALQTEMDAGWRRSTADDPTRNCTTRTALACGAKSSRNVGQILNVPLLGAYLRLRSISLTTLPTNIQEREMRKQLFIVGVVAAMTLTGFISPAGAAEHECQGKTATIVGTDGPDTLEGTDGDDVIVALGGRDWVLANGGDDLICGGGGRDDLWGGPGHDVIHGGKWTDVLSGDQGNDELHGGSWRDALWGGEGDDSMYGESASDHFYPGGGADVLYGGGGFDRLWHWEAATVDVAAGTSTTRNNDTTFQGIDGFKGSDYADVFVGSDNRDLFTGRGGDDTITGNGGDDRLAGTTGSDTVNGGDGNDFLSGGGHDDTVNGGAGDDNIYGNWGTDTVDGGDDNDTCRGETLTGCEVVEDDAL